MQVMFSLILAHTYLNICMSFLFADFSVHLTYIIIYGIHYYKFPVCLHTYQLTYSFKNEIVIIISFIGKYKRI